MQRINFIVREKYILLLYIKRIVRLKFLTQFRKIFEYTKYLIFDNENSSLFSLFMKL